MATKAELITRIDAARAEIAQCETELAEIASNKPYKILVCTQEIVDMQPVSNNIVINSATFFPNMKDLREEDLLRDGLSIVNMVPVLDE